MLVIIIGGPSGSGKTTLSMQILEKLKNGLVLSTDNYYHTGLFSRILSKIIDGYFDRKISFNYKLFKKDFDFITKERRSNHTYLYDFDSKTTKELSTIKTDIQLLIVEGIFAKEILRNSYLHNYFLIELKTNKQTCMQRAIYRDINVRGKNEKNAKNEFLKSWKHYYMRYKKISKKYYKYEIDFSRKDDIDKLITKIINL